MPAPAKLLNVGPKSAAWLRQVGIRSQADLEAAGSVGAFVKVKRAGFRPSLNLLYALEGALLGCHWQQVPEARRTQLLAEAEAAEALLPPPRGRMAAAVVVERPGNSDEAGAMAPEPSFGFDDPAGGDGGSDSSGGGD